MATTKTTKPAPKKKVAAKKKKVTSPTAFPGTRKLGNELLKDLKAGAKVVMPLANKAMTYGKEMLKAGAKKITVKNVTKVLNSKVGTKGYKASAPTKTDKFRDAGPKYARGGVAKRMRKFQLEGETMEGAPKPTSPSVTTAPTTVSRPAATTPAAAPTAPAASAKTEKSKSDLMSEMISAGYNPRQIKKALGTLEAAPKVRVDPNTIISAVGNLGTAAINTFGNRGGGGGGAPSGGGGNPFERNGGTVKRKLMKASEGVIVKMNGNQPVQKRAGSKGVRSGVNPKAKASKVTRGRVGGTSTAPKKALPKAGYGMMMKSKKG